MDFESILEEILLGRGQGNLKLKPKQKEALQRSRLFKNCRNLFLVANEKWCTVKLYQISHFQ